MLVIDYSWSRPDLGALRAAGCVAVVRYLARGTSGKILSPAERDAIHAAGLGIALVWETTASRAGEGALAGSVDVVDAEALADRLGAPDWLPIFYAVDFDTTADVVRPYLRAVLAAARRPVGVYGSFRVVEGLPEVPWVWQCAAWSKGAVSGRAHLFQRVGSSWAGTDENDLIQPFPFWHPGGHAVWTNPVPGRISSDYGPRAAPLPSPHLGTDIAGPIGTPVVTPAAGVVTKVKTGAIVKDKTPNGVLPARTGNAVLIDHGNGVSTYAGHLSRVDVAPGQKVKAGQTIGALGQTGNITGPHVHFEVHVNGATVDPRPFLKARGVTLGQDTTPTPMEDDMTPELAARLEQIVTWLDGRINQLAEFTRDSTATAVSASTAAVLAALPAGGGDVDPETIRAAVEAGVRDAIASIETTVTVKGA